MDCDANVSVAQQFWHYDVAVHGHATIPIECCAVPLTKIVKPMGTLVGEVRGVTVDHGGWCVCGRDAHSKVPILCHRPSINHQNTLSNCLFVVVLFVLPGGASADGRNVGR